MARTPMNVPRQSRRSHVHAALAMALGMAVAAFASPARAQEEAASETVHVTLPEVTVTALRTREDVRRIPAAAFVLSGDRLRDAAAPRLSSLIASLPGLYAYQQGPSGDPTTVDPRGFTANGLSSYLKVLIDGQDTRDVENGNVDWDWLMPEDAQRVELVQGPAAWAYGDGTEGGILNIVRTEPLEGTHVRVAARGGSFGLAGGNVGLGWARGQRSASLDGGYRVVDGFRDRSREEVGNAGLRMVARPGFGGRWTASVSWLDAQREDPGYLTPEQLAADRTQSETLTDYNDTRRLLVGLGFSAGQERTGEWTVTPYFRDERGEQVKTVFFETRFHPTEANVYGADAGWRRAVTLGGHPLALHVGGTLEKSTLDSDYRADASESSALLTSARAERQLSALYASGRLEVMGMVTLRAGARGDWIQIEAEDRLNGGELGPDRTLSAFSPFASFSHAVGTQGSLYLSYSQAFHAPTLDQIYGQRPFSNPFPPFDPPFFVISNAGLDPQRAASFEAGGRWDGAGGEYAMLTLYRIAVEDEIDFDLASFRYANLSKSVHSGVQGAGSMRFGRGLAAFASATWQPTTIDGGDLDGNQINAVPEAMAAGRLSWSANAWLGVEAGARWVGRQWLDKENDHPLGDYATFDLGASARFSRLRASVRVGNVLDREIVETGFIGATGEERLYPAAGRHFTVALKYE